MMDKHSKFYFLLSRFLIFLLIFSWIFSGWPQIWKNSPIPPKIAKTQAQTGISFIGSVSGYAANGGDVILDLTTLGLQQGDLVIVAYSIGDNDGLDFTMAIVSPTGYTKVADLFADDTQEVNLGVFWKVMGATPDTSVTVDGQGGTDAAVAAVAMAFRGVDPTTPMDVTPTTATGINTMNPNPPLIDYISASGVWTVIVGASGHALGGTGYYTFPTGYTLNPISRGSDDTNDTTVGMGYRTDPLDPEDPGIMTHSGLDSTSYSWAAVTIALRPIIPPSVSTVSLNGGNNINLTENTTTLVSVTGTVSDLNGYQDISSVIGKIFRSGVSGAENCTLDDNNCYQTTCATSSCAGTTCNFTCDFNVWFHADPTDSGTWAAEYWVAWVKVDDYQNNSSSATNTAQTVDVNSLLALDVTSQINYGTMLPGETIDPLSITSTVTTTGNVAIDVQISGTDMTSGPNSISVSQQRYATSSVSFTLGYTLTTTPTLLELDTVKPTQHPSNQFQNVYWGIQIPLGTPIGNYSGQITFTAVAD